MVLINNLKFFHVSIFGKIRQENVFDNILERKRVFLDSKIKKLKNSKNQDFSKGVIVHGFGKKIEIFPPFYFRLNRPGKYFCLYSREEKGAFRL